MKLTFGSLVVAMAVLLSCQPMSPQNESRDILIRLASFNVSMEARNYLGPDETPQEVTGDELLEALRSGDNRQIRTIARVLQRVRPDIVLLNEFDHTRQPQKAIELFQQLYLSRGSADTEAIRYPYSYTGPVNTGELMPVDVDGDGVISAPGDAHGFGYFPGHYGMVVLSRFPINHEAVRDFRQFRWSQMPDALKPLDASGEPYYSPEAWQALRLSSKAHWDIPVGVGDRTLHLLVSHPTPPVFDGAADRNGRRNHDEIRLWVDYLSGRADYLTDTRGRSGGLEEGAPFAVMGDLNASPVEGDGRPEAIRALLEHPKVQDPRPTSRGGALARPENPHSDAHTAAWGMRADYVLPSAGLRVLDSGVYWPAPGSPEAALVAGRENGSDHRLVWVDLAL